MTRNTCSVNRNFKIKSEIISWKFLKFEKLREMEQQQNTNTQNRKRKQDESSSPKSSTTNNNNVKDNIREENYENEYDRAIKLRKTTPSNNLNFEDDKNNNKQHNCPYLDTINRSLLDFDFEKVCSVSSMNTNIYCCLVCGKYFQGRGATTWAYYHSLHVSHHVFINLHNEKIYCLPDNYEVQDSSLEDIKFALHPKFTIDQIRYLDHSTKLYSALDGSLYLPGFIGLNNINVHNDYMNCILHSLAHVPPLRNFFIKEENLQNNKSILVQSFAELIRKIWSPRNFKSHISPHEVFQAISVASNKKFKIGAKADPLEFLSWFLNYLHKELGGTAKEGSSVIHRIFQGKVRVETTDVKQVTMERSTPFLFLSLDIPQAPLFKDDFDGRNLIPQVPLFTCLAKFDGQTVIDDPIQKLEKKYSILKLPQFLIIHLKRFTQNNFLAEKNPTIVTFPLSSLDMRDYIYPKLRKEAKNTKYDLMTNVCQVSSSSLDTGASYRVNVQSKATGQWFEIEDLRVTELLPQIITVSESHIQFYQLINNKQ